MTEALSASDFSFVRALLSERSGMLIEPDRRGFVELRLSPLARAEGMESVKDLLAVLREAPGAGLSDRVVEALLLHETRFFRDAEAFQTLERSVLPALIAARREEKTLHIWCAACSTGQEPYSVAMLIKTSFPELEGWHVRILATDLSAEALRRAREARYSALEVSRGPVRERLAPWLRPEGSTFVVLSEVRRLVEFRDLNLIAPWPRLPAFDLVLLRNVLIYFAQQTRHAVLGGVRRLLRPDGALMLGSGELPPAGAGFHTDLADAALFFRPGKGVT